MASTPTTTASNSGGDASGQSESGGGGGILDRAMNFLSEPLGMGLAGGIVLSIALGYLIL